MAPPEFDWQTTLSEVVSVQPAILDKIKALLGVFIRGIEVTQAIQYYRAAEHLTDAADQGADNSVTLVQGKPAWVRVYVRSGLLSQMYGVTGTVVVERRQFGFIYTPVATLAAQPPGTVTAKAFADYATERSTLTDTLNFIIPADEMCGTLRLRIRIEAPGGYVAETTRVIQATLRQTLRVAGIMVGYNGPANSNPGAPNVTLAAPTVADLQTTAAWTLLTFPVRSAATYRNAGTITWNLPLTDAPSCNGCCTPNWVALNAAVQAQKVADGNQPGFLYYGLMANGIPMGPIVGCNSGGVSTGSVGGGVTMAHELGHACGLPHAPCGTPGDPNYPAYEPYDPANTPQASIGEYGLDVSNGNILEPDTFKDMMAYCGPRWISLYNYGRLTNNSNLNPVHVCKDKPWWKDYVEYDPFLLPEEWLPDPPPDPTWRRRFVNPEPVISLIGIVHADREVELTSVMRLTAMREVAGGERTDMVAELLSVDGRVVASGPVFSLRSESHGGSGCGCAGEKDEDRYPHLLQAFVPDVETGVALRVRRGDEELWVRKAPDTPIRVTGFKARLGRGSQVALQWSTRGGGEQEPEVWAQWSADQGETWRALTTGLQGGKAVVDGSGLPAGEVMLRLLASDGFHTAVSEPVVLKVPEQPPAVSIMSPRQGQTMIAGSTMRLWGAVAAADGTPVEVEKSQWLLDGKPVAESTLDTFIAAPEAGEHKLALVVYGQGGEAAATVSFVTVGVPEAPEPTT